MKSITILEEKTDILTSPEHLMKKLAGTELDFLKAMVSLGELAPSVHNTQPWQITIAKNSIEVRLNEQNLLENSDPTRREATISLGAFLENIKFAATVMGISLKTSEGTGITTIYLSNRELKLSPANIKKLQILFKRHTYRNNFLPLKDRKRFVKKIKQIQLPEKIKLEILTSDHHIDKIAQMSSKATKLAMNIGPIRKELRQHISLQNRPRKSISARSLSPHLIGAIYEGLLMNSFLYSIKAAKRESNRLLSASIVVAIFSAGDTLNDWKNSGQAYERVCLLATELGLCTTTTAALVEAPEYYKDVAKLCDTSMRLQAIVALGAFPKNYKLVRSSRNHKFFDLHRVYNSF